MSNCVVYLQEAFCQSASCRLFSPLRRCFTSSAVCRKKLPHDLKNRSRSSQEWLTRHINDPYVKKAKMENYRARSAFKLIEIDDRFRIFQPGQLVVDCGAAPGAWTQVATSRVNARDIELEQPVGKVIAIDLHYINPINGAYILSHADFTLPKVQQQVIVQLQGRQADIVLSDMAPNASGVKEMDNENIVLLATSALTFAIQTLAVGGHFLCKVWEGSQTKKLESHIERFFVHLKHIKPPSSRNDSTELFLLGREFRGIHKQ